MNNLQIFNKDIIPVYTTDEGNKVVMGRELHEKLGIKDKYTDWMQRMIGAGFIEGSDYFTLREKPKRKDGTEMPGERINHIMTLDMAKHIAMTQRTPPIIIAFAVLLGISWGVTCAAVWAICALMHWTFTWSAGTAAWIALWLLGSFGSSKK